MFRDDPDFIKILNWHSAMKYFCSVSRSDLYGTDFGRNFRSLRDNAHQCVIGIDWIAPCFTPPDLSDLVITYPAVKLFTFLRHAYEDALAQHEETNKKIRGQVAAAPLNDLQRVDSAPITKARVPLSFSQVESTAYILQDYAAYQNSLCSIEVQHPKDSLPVVVDENLPKWSSHGILHRCHHDSRSRLEENIIFQIN
jgi:hypothetical protein